MSLLKGSSSFGVSSVSVRMSGQERGRKQRCDEGPGICSVILTMFSILLVLATLPFSLLFVVKVVQVLPAVISDLR